ncbi:segregation/condensation protein A [Sporolactobacillus shoreae]|uniref:Segregation and condensation protein A n=1 Tax=Sporolactobacillus shoreae TaxID=1465501 RepID=A0A4Z0GM98_9BACL|nr:segregation/condensation protein A [Sporolactobacillus shoreae]TGA98159.1 segregation/condensation protein A [Sporolactobacillus shoreae]
MEYKVKIDAFEGPLDLLLHLIKTLEIDIYDIPVAEITDQYLDFIHNMQKLELNVASEYLVMAATLIAMKSRMLLPKPEVYDEAADEPYEDPEETRQTLMQQLLEYRQYKEAAQSLRSGESERLLLFSKQPEDLSEFEREDVTAIPKSERATVHDMMRAFQRMLIRKKLETPLDTKIDRQVLPIGQQMNRVLEDLKRARHPLRFDLLFTKKDRAHIIVTFLALLELMKKDAVFCEQDRNFADIFVSLGKGAALLDTGENAFNY